MLDRNVIIKRAIDECMEEMYLKAQPSVNFKELVQKVKSGEIEDSRDNPIYNRYYLSMEEFEYIRNKYVEAYGLKSHWIPNIELLESYLKEGGSKDKYIPETMEENGFIHPGYCSYEKVKSLTEQLKECISDKETLNKVTNIVFDTINECKNFYRFDRELSDFNVSIALGASPTSNKETVEKYWESQGKPIKIVDRNPLLLWEMDYYGKDFEEVMLDEYGPNWKEYWDKKLQEKLEEDKKRREEERKKWENYKPSPKFKIGDLVRSREDSIAREVFAIQEEGYRVVGDFIPFEEENKWYHCYEQFKNY
jgi:hypothetical protein